MAVRNPAKIPKKQIGSVDVTGFSGGMYLNGEQNAKGNQIVDGHDVEMTVDGFIVPRKSLTPWLPDTIEDGYQIYPAIWEGEVINFTADDGKIRYCVDGDDDWTDAIGDNTITTGNGGKPIFSGLGQR